MRRFLYYYPYKDIRCLGTVIECKHCDHVRAKQYRSEPEDWNQYNKSGWYSYYRCGQGICKSCVEERNLWVLKPEEKQLFHEFREQVRKSKHAIPSFVGEAVRAYDQTITPEVLESLNPEAVRRYKESGESVDLERKYLPARVYVEEIRADLIAYMSENIGRIAKGDEAYQLACKELIDKEMKVRKFLAKTARFSGFCEERIVYERTERSSWIFLWKRRKKEKTRRDARFRELCKGKELTREPFYQEIEIRGDLQKLLDESVSYHARSALERTGAFQIMMDTLPRRIVEEGFWE